MAIDEKGSKKYNIAVLFLNKKLSMEALIFDMDGVIIDSEYHWNHDEEAFLVQIVPGWTEEDLQRIIGMNIVDTYRLLSTEYNLRMQQEVFLEEVNRIATRIYQEKTNLMPGFLDLLQKLIKRGVPIGLASSSMRSWIDIVLDRFELRHLFNSTVSAQEIEGNGKPAPDIYLHSAKELGVKPANCFVIEDSKNGTLSGKGAGMTVLGFRNGFNEKQDLSEADHIIEGFRDPKISTLLNL